MHPWAQRSAGWLDFALAGLLGLAWLDVAELALVGLALPVLTCLSWLGLVWLGFGLACFALACLG